MLKPITVFFESQELMLSIECLFSNSPAFPSIRFFKPLMFLFAPLICIVTLITFWTMYYRYKKKQTNKLGKNVELGTAIVFFLMYPSMIKHSLSFFKCHTLVDGTTWLRLDMQIECWGPAHTPWAFGIGVMMLVCWVFLVPVFCLLIMIRNRHNLDEHDIHDRYKLLFDGYKKRFFYWEYLNLL